MTTPTVTSTSIPLRRALSSGLRGLPRGVRTRVAVFRLVIVLAGWLRALMDRRLAADGLTTQQAALLAVTEQGEPPTLGEAAAALGVSHQNVRQLVAALSRKQLLDVRTDLTDQRVRRLSATPRARAIFSARDRDDFTAVAGWFGSLSTEEVVVLHGLLERLAVSLEAARAQ